MKDLRISKLNDIYGGLLTGRQSEVVKHYYDYDLSYAEIAEIFDITRQGAGQIIEAARKQLENFDNVLGLYDILERLETLGQTITEESSQKNLDEIIAKLGKH